MHRIVISGQGQQVRAAGNDTNDVGGVERFPGATVGEGCSGVAHVGVGGPCDEAAVAVASVASAMVQVR